MHSLKTITKTLLLFQKHLFINSSFTHGEDLRKGHTTLLFGHYSSCI